MTLPPSSAQNNQSAGSNSSAAKSTTNPQANTEETMALMEKLVLELRNPELREKALAGLKEKKESFQDLALVLWHSFGTITALLQEITSVYPCLSSPSTLTEGASTRVCNALALFQCVAADPETRAAFLKAQIPEYMYPFLNTKINTRPFEYLRLTSLGVIGALVKVDNTEVVKFLLQTEALRRCFEAMDIGSELSKTVAIFIVQKILSNDVGMRHICTQAPRFFGLAVALAKMVHSLAQQPSSRLLKYIIRCYLSLSENPRACSALQNCLPDLLRDKRFTECLSDDLEAMAWLKQLLINVAAGPLGTPAARRGLNVVSTNPILSTPTH